MFEFYLVIILKWIYDDLLDIILGFFLDDYYLFMFLQGSEGMNKNDFYSILFWKIIFIPFHLC